MARGLGVVGLIVVVVAAVAMASLSRAEYVQTSCEIDPQSKYAVIWMQDAEALGKPNVHSYSIAFEPAGLTVRFPPTYYAPEWGDTDVVLEYPNEGASSGVLKLRSKGTLGWSVKTIGRVQRPCWNAVKKYIREHVESRGVVVHISETTAR